MEKWNEKLKRKRGSKHQGSTRNSLSILLELSDCKFHKENLKKEKRKNPGFDSHLSEFPRQIGPNPSARVRSCDFRKDQEKLSQAQYARYEIGDLLVLNSGFDQVLDPDEKRKRERAKCGRFVCERERELKI